VRVAAQKVLKRKKNKTKKEMGQGK